VTGARSNLTAHLRQLEAEAIGIFRETAAESRNPVLMYSRSGEL
jgi:3'-phosphoadenosine 5'-phosphosulfate sulfotransferase (PAPS reductase)/FAD synthetase